MAAAPSDLGFGVLGSGRMGLTYAECLTRHTSGARLAAVCGGSRAPGLAEQYAVPCATSLDDLLSRSDVEAVIVATPHSRHREHVQRIADAGKHVLVEKPMALHTADCDAMIDASTRAGVTLGVVQTARYTAPARAARQAIVEGRIGQVRMLQLTWLEAGYFPSTPEGMNSWASDPAEGGAFLDAGVHAFDLLRWLAASEAVQVFGRSLTYTEPRLPRLSGMAQVSFASGAIGSVWISFELPRPGFPERTMHTRVVGSDGVLDLDSYGKLAVGNADGRRVLVSRAPYDSLDLTSDRRLEQFIVQTQDFVDALRDGRTPPVTGIDGRAAVAMVEACYRSGATGQPIGLGARDY
jgi:myo-inositol 2-dehydrogenase/D-chiro-inositol 1-dehydrogenase